MLTRLFPNKFVDIITIGSMVRPIFFKFICSSLKRVIFEQYHWESRFDDNQIMSASKVLGLTNMQSKQIGLT